jgi:hypothetical protein
VPPPLLVKPAKPPIRAEYVEGYSHRVSVNAYERNRRALDACLQHFGRSCRVCGLSFEARYGEAAAGYIEVYHVVPLARESEPDIDSIPLGIYDRFARIVTRSFITGTHHSLSPRLR